MNINNEPTIEPRTITGIFTKYIAKTLPLAFDESMSYYECLCALLEYINDTVVPDINNVNNGLGELQTFYTELQDFVNHYFDNLDIQTEINNKLDEMTEDGSLSEIFGQYVSSEIQPQLDYQANEIANIQSQITSIGNSTPIAVSNVSQMTDQSKIYVLTTDGKWYYYDGTSWVAGGTYQSTGIGTNEIQFNNLNNKLTNDLYGYSTDVSTLGMTTQNYADNSVNYSTPMYLKKGTVITVSDSFVANYHWTLRRITQLNGYQAIFPETTDTTYTLLNDEYCVFSWRPIDNNWNTEDYTVNHWKFLTNDDITSIIYYYPLKTNSITIPFDKSSLIKNSLIGSAHNGATKLPYAQSNRAGITKPVKFDYDLQFHIASGYNYGVMTWNNNTTLGEDNFISDSGWLSQDTIIPKNTYFTFTIREANNNSLRGIEISDLYSLSNYADFNYADNKINQLINDIGDYNYTGEDLNLQYKHGVEFDTLYAMTGYTSSSQGFDIYGNYIVQLYNGAGIEIKNFETGENVSWIPLTTFNHGDTCQFSNKKYDSSDLFPLLYVVSDTTPSVVRVVRIVDTTHASVIKEYELGSASETGYYAGQCFDFDNNLIYSFGYTQNSYRDSSNNKTIVAVYDLNNVTEVSTNRYKPTLIDNYVMDFIYCIQGQKFINGMCYLLSSFLYTEQTNKIYVYDPVRKLFKAIFEEFPTSILNPELEDIAFVKGSTNYDIIIGSRSYYWKMSIL